MISWARDLRFIKWPSVLLINSAEIEFNALLSVPSGAVDVSGRTGQKGDLSEPGL